MQGSEEDLEEGIRVPRGRSRRRRRRRRRRIMPIITNTSSSSSSSITSTSASNNSEALQSDGDGGLLAVKHPMKHIPGHHGHEPSLSSSSSSTGDGSTTATIAMDPMDADADDDGDDGGGNGQDDDGKDAMNFGSIANDDDDDDDDAGNGQDDDGKDAMNFGSIANDDDDDDDGGNGQDDDGKDAMNTGSIANDDDDDDDDDGKEDNDRDGDGRNIGDGDGDGDSDGDDHGDGDSDGHEEEFKCNICLNTASDAVVTLCGHLFCWPCLYTWLHFHSKLKQCPVCKGSTNESNLVPIYNTCTTTTAAAAAATTKSTIAIDRRRLSTHSNQDANNGDGDGDGDDKVSIPPRPHASRGQIESSTPNHHYSSLYRNTNAYIYYASTNNTPSSCTSHHHHHHLPHHHNHSNYRYTGHHSNMEASYHLMVGRESRASWLERLRAMREERLAWPVALVQGLTSRELMQQRRRQGLLACSASNAMARPVSTGMRSPDQLHPNPAVPLGGQDSVCDRRGSSTHDNDAAGFRATSLSATQSSGNTSDMYAQSRLGEQPHGIHPMGGGAVFHYLSTMNSILTSMEVFARALEVSTMSTEYIDAGMPSDRRYQIAAHHGTSLACGASQLLPHGLSSASSPNARQSLSNNVFMHANYEDNGTLHHFNNQCNHAMMDQDRYYAEMRGLLGKMERLMGQLQSIKPGSIVNKQPHNHLLHPMGSHCQDTINYLDMPHHHHQSMNARSSFAQNYPYNSMVEHHSNNVGKMATNRAIMLERNSSSTSNNINVRSSSHSYSNVSSSDPPCDDLVGGGNMSSSISQPPLTTCNYRKRWDVRSMQTR